MKNLLKIITCIAINDCIYYLHHKALILSLIAVVFFAQIWLRERRHRCSLWDDGGFGDHDQRQVLCEAEIRCGGQNLPSGESRQLWVHRPSRQHHHQEPGTWHMLSCVPVRVFYVSSGHDVLPQILKASQSLYWAFFFFFLPAGSADNLLWRLSNHLQTQRDR